MFPSDKLKYSLILWSAKPVDCGCCFTDINYLMWSDTRGNKIDCNNSNTERMYEQSSCFNMSLKIGFHVFSLSILHAEGEWLNMFQTLFLYKCKTYFPLGNGWSDCSISISFHQLTKIMSEIRVNAFALPHLNWWIEVGNVALQHIHSKGEKQKEERICDILLLSLISLEMWKDY